MDKLRRERELKYFHANARSIGWLSIYYNKSKGCIRNWRLLSGIKRPVELLTYQNGKPTKEFLREIYIEKDGNLINKYAGGGPTTIGDNVGCSRKDGYFQVGLYNKSFRLHNLIWIYYNGDIPNDMTIDHIKGLSNTLSNLRLATKSEQNRNISTNIKEQSKIRGVTFSNNKWIVVLDRKYLGTFNTMEEAEIFSNKNQWYKKYKKPVTINKLFELFDDPSDGNIVRLKTRGNQVMGSIAGSLSKQGYMTTMVNDKHMYNHIIVYTLCQDRWPIGDIHHIDFNKVNNNINNLIDVSKNIHKIIHQEFKNTGTIMSREDIVVLIKKCR